MRNEPAAQVVSELSELCPDGFLSTSCQSQKGTGSRVGFRAGLLVIDRHLSKSTQSCSLSPRPSHVVLQEDQSENDSRFTDPADG